MNDIKNANELEKKKYHKQYFEDNREELTRKIKCDDCGGVYMTTNKSNHFKTKKHTNAIQMNKLQNELEELRMKNVVTYF